MHGQEGEVNCTEHQSLLKGSSWAGLGNKSEGRTGGTPQCHQAIRPQAPEMLLIIAE